MNEPPDPQNIFGGETEEKESVWPFVGISWNSEISQFGCDRIPVHKLTTVTA